MRLLLPFPSSQSSSPSSFCSSFFLPFCSSYKYRYPLLLYHRFLFPPSQCSSLSRNNAISIKLLPFLFLLFLVLLLLVLLLVLVLYEHHNNNRLPFILPRPQAILLFLQYSAIHSRSPRKHLPSRHPQLSLSPLSCWI